MLAAALARCADTAPGRLWTSFERWSKSHCLHSCEISGAGPPRPQLGSGRKERAGRGGGEREPARAAGGWPRAPWGRKEYRTGKDGGHG